MTDLDGKVILLTGATDVLVNNAGIGDLAPGGGTRRESDDGFELLFAVNYLAGYALSRLLLPLLIRSAPSRIVNVASAGQQAIDFSDVMLIKDYNGLRAYRQSKLAQIMNAFDLAEELQPAGVMVNALHPATFMPTKMVFAAPLSTIAEGVAATMQLIAAPSPGTGRYYNGLNASRANDQAYDAEARRQLRALSDRLPHRRQVRQRVECHAGQQPAQEHIPVRGQPRSEPGRVTGQGAGIRQLVHPCTLTQLPGKPVWAGWEAPG
jgi:NAD(P)-dependent dehydrogenase (short-subunit alcohol dehydrogenase family)